ncbi:MAG: diguanylate cyclase, partial [Ruminococcus sp.]|nr:diguanylate cyclase [Ruminococcus sp.]
MKGSYIVMNEREIKEMLERIAALERKNSSLENKMNSLEKQVETVNKFVAAITESQSVETAMNEIESVTKQLTDCDKATFYCYDGSADKFFSQGDYRNWQDVRSAEEIKTAFRSQKIKEKENEAMIPLVTSKGKSLGVIVAEKEGGFKKEDFEGFKKGSHMVNTVELALKKEYEHQGRITDELTNLKNRQGLNEYLKNTLYGNLNDEKPVSIVMCDIDRFKAVNDTYGHEAGDVILKDVAAVLNEGTREGADCAFRMGGEEMVLILNCSHEKAIDISERLREQIENTSHTVMREDVTAEVKVTVSMGVCDVRPNENIEISPDNIREVFDEELARADRAAYNAKNNGRNQVVSYDPNIYRSYLAEKTAEILCGGIKENIPEIKESVSACLNSSDEETFYSVIDALQEYAAE